MMKQNDYDINVSISINCPYCLSSLDLEEVYDFIDLDENSYYVDYDEGRHEIDLTGKYKCKKCGRRFTTDTEIQF